jgi:hypothetical protein
MLPLKIAIYNTSPYKRLRDGENYFKTSFGRIFCSAKNWTLRGQNHAVHGFAGAPEASKRIEGRITEANVPVNHVEFA